MKLGWTLRGGANPGAKLWVLLKGIPIELDEDEDDGAGAGSQASSLPRAAEPANVAAVGRAAASLCPNVVSTA